MIVYLIPLKRFTMKYVTFMYKDTEEDGFIAVVPDLPGCVAYGDTEEEACEMMQDATELWLEDEELPPAHPVKHFTEKVLNELKIPLTASQCTLLVTEEDHKSYTVEVLKEQ